MQGPEFSGALQKIPAIHLLAEWDVAEYSAPRAVPRTFRGPVLPLVFMVPTVFFAASAYFCGRLSVYHMPDHAFIADKHDPAYYKRLIDPEVRAGREKFGRHRKFGQGFVTVHHAGPLGLCPTPSPVRGPTRRGAGRGLIYVPQSRVQCSVGHEIFAPPRPKANPIPGPLPVARPLPLPPRPSIDRD